MISIVSMLISISILIDQNSHSDSLNGQTCTSIGIDDIDAGIDVDIDIDSKKGQPVSRCKRVLVLTVSMLILISVLILTSIRTLNKLGSSGRHVLISTIC